MDDLQEARRVIADLEAELTAYRSGAIRQTYFTKFPPASLVARVGGADPNGNVFPDFLVSGLQVVHNMLAIFARHGMTQSDFSRILDFGCGCGRVIRFLAYERFKAELVGCDIDPEAIAWCRENIDTAKFTVSPYHPPLEFPDASFDFIYSISIFTHLNEKDQFAWLTELRRITRPGGRLILTIQGRNQNYEGLPSEVKEELQRDGIWYDTSNIYFETNKTYGFAFPESFKLTYHTHEYIRRNWSKYFKILEIADKAISYNQDAVVLERAR
jgi:cyclopropane fatty-acyl-phospholipid synthase-like methyltransferase